MKITLDDLTHPAVAKLLGEHLEDMYASSPAESVHALDLSALQKPHIRFFTLWHGEELAACGALKRLNTDTAELKSMRAASQFRGKGYGRAILKHLMQDARSSGVERLYLETGSTTYFEAARSLYLSEGFEYCAPFGDYSEDPFSSFMTTQL